MSYYGWTTYTFDEKVDLEVTKCWMMAVPYSIPVRKPFHHWAILFYDVRSFAWAADQLMVPTSKGVTWRSIEGLYYLGLRVTTPEEEKQREPIYRERIKPWIEDFGGIWRGKLIPEMMGHFERLKKADLGKLGNIQLMEHFEYYLSVKQRVWEIHFLPMYASYLAYRDFGLMCQELLGINEDHLQFKKLLSGFTTKIYEVDRGLWRLGDRARELGLEPLFKATPDDEEALRKMEQSAAGKKWLNEFREFLNEHGWRTEILLDCCMPSWIEKPALALPAIRGDMAKGGAFLMDREHDRLVKEREEAERDVLSRVPKDKKDWFGKLMRTAQWSGVYSEEHNYTVDCYMPAVGRHILVEIGNRGFKAGLLDDPDDVNFLMPEEIIRLLANMETSAARKAARIRRGEWQRFIDGAPKMMAEKLMIGDPGWFFQNLGREPVMWVFAGAQKVKPELKADLYGIASAPGVAEGIARVLMDPAQLAELQPGEILVVPSTNPTWHPAFNFVKAVVTDAGGSLSHAVIVARDYSLPCVAGTREATTKIKTGDRIKVDGDNYAVYILKRAS
jgi:phosphohistidine swiveling domain-containing protein